MTKNKINEGRVSYQLSQSIEGVTECAFEFKYILGKGGNASVYKETIGAKAYAVKIYDNSNAIDYTKLLYMEKNPPKALFQSYEGHLYPAYSWPLALVKKSTQAQTDKLIGYVTPLIDEKSSHTLDHFYDFNLTKRLKSGIAQALSFRCEILFNLCYLLNELHAAKHHFIDIKPQNIRVFEDANIVALLDCDGFSIYDNENEKYFKGTMVSGDYIAPELWTANSLDQTKIDINQDLYALAVIIFQMLNNGIHPFQGVLKDSKISETTNDGKARLGLYPYGLNGNEKISPHFRSIHNLFLLETRLLFERAFLGAANRPSSEEWMEHFRWILDNKEIVRCPIFPNDVRHMRFANLECPACYLNNLNIDEVRKIEKRSSGSIRRKASKPSVINSSQQNIAQSTSRTTNSIVGRVIIFTIIVVGLIYAAIKLQQNKVSSKPTAPIRNYSTSDSVILIIEGRRVEVSGRFNALSREEQDATIDEIAARIRSEP